MVEKLSIMQIVEIKEAFAVFDREGFGSIGANELERVLESLGHKPDKEELKEMIAEIDTDGNGIIDFPEFLTMMAKKVKHNKQEDEILETFRMLDEDGTGEIPVEKMKQVMANLDSKLTEEEIDEMIAEVDADGNGTVDFDEFSKMMNAASG